jgi:1,4-alpha-glucan branching enzyme
MVRLFRFIWKVFILASVFGIGYIIGREHSFEEDEEWDLDEDLDSEGKKTDDATPAAPTGNEKPVAFTHKDEKATSVSVVGDFNDWNKDKNPLKLESGVWKAEILLTPGKHEYKFVVNNTEWIIDPAAAETAPDKYGGKSSVVIVA